MGLCLSKALPWWLLKIPGFQWPPSLLLEVRGSSPGKLWSSYRWVLLVKLGLEMRQWPELVALSIAWHYPASFFCSPRGLGGGCCPFRSLSASCQHPSVSFSLFQKLFAFGRAPGKSPFLRFVYFSSDSQNRVMSQLWIAFLARLPASSPSPSHHPCLPPPQFLPHICVLFSCPFLHL